MRLFCLFFWDIHIIAAGFGCWLRFFCFFEKFLSAVIFGSIVKIPTSEISRLEKVSLFWYCFPAAYSDL